MIAVVVIEDKLFNDLFLSALVQKGEDHPLNGVDPTALDIGEGLGALRLIDIRGYDDLSGRHKALRGDMDVLLLAVIADEDLPFAALFMHRGRIKGRDAL
jgi:hypothetical protein